MIIIKRYNFSAYSACSAVRFLYVIVFMKLCTKIKSSNGIYMKLTHATARYILISIMSIAVIALAYPSGQAQTQETGKPKTPEQFISIDFNNVDINVFIKFMSELTGTNFVVDQRVKGKVTIISPSKISLTRPFPLFRWKRPS